MFFCRISGLNPILQPENGKADIQRKITWIDMDSREAQDSHVWIAQESGCLILVDLDNMEAASTAFVLLGLIRKKVMAGVQGSIPHVLMKLSYTNWVWWRWSPMGSNFKSHTCAGWADHAQSAFDIFLMCSMLSALWLFLLSLFSISSPRKENKVPNNVRSVLLICSFSVAVLGGTREDLWRQLHKFISSVLKLCERSNDVTVLDDQKSETFPKDMEVVKLSHEFFGMSPTLWQMLRKSWGLP